MLAASFQPLETCELPSQTVDGSAPEMTNQDQITRIRVTYTKGESLRFTGHLDMQRAWERLLRRSGLPIRYSQGFHPRARMNLASALPLGFVSKAEMLDFWMDEPLPTDQIQKKLAAAAPPGLVITAVNQVSLSDDAIQSKMHASEFEVSFFDPQDEHELSGKVSSLLSIDEIMRTRRKKTYDLRPLILAMDLIQTDDGEVGITMQLLAEPGQTGRPDEVLEEMGYQNTEYLVTRTRIILA
jgi:radical SAM-linked protein